MFDRFKGAAWFPEIEKYTPLIVGAGGIGSWTALFLAKAGFKTMYIVDNDYVDNTNLSGQFYKKGQTSKLKVTQVVESIKEYSNCSIIAIPFLFETPFVPKVNIFISAVDNIEGRLKVYDAFLTSNQPNKLFIDGRLSAEFFQIHALTDKSIPIEHEAYLESVKLLNTLEDDVCTYKQTSHVAACIGTYITSMITNHLSNIALNENLFKVGFVEFNTQML